jgi:hypothetical protein
MTTWTNDTKYRRYPQYVAPMVTTELRSTTIKLAPHAVSP